MKILIIEDEKKIADSIKQGLIQEAFVVDTAYDGNDGYDLAYSEKYDLIILDLMLPGMDGTKICENLRKVGNHTPILMLTAKTQTSDKIKGLNCGADDYLAKPFDFEELLARIMALRRRPVEIKPTKYIYHDLVLDTNNIEVSRNGIKIDLSKKEFTLLEYLLRNKGHVVTKENIMQNVWDFESDVLPNTIEVYIRYLRNKIDRPFKKSKQLIKTIRGYGYKIEYK
ncbi:DNA-binding response regulator [candidate division WWE3 bacterium RBG_19FT_COMBO_34_6]|uniref:DNA-binding response regulator n=1 Tax=candidate division WWE3 bacterium RBG_19FT_COMBO_34_6 TaxID=1802612 RepID=A0A1F4UNA6_UNCKA|nr:MAG: DNA-binding response regulator [candidate division WWE3 bacterium RBG_19FT_COMBO_34_6]